MVKLDKLVQYAKATGYIFQGSELYGGLANTWDYGPLGSVLKKNIKDAWIKRFVREKKENVLFDSSILLNSDVWVASGHLSNFSDPLTECRKCNNRFRADKLLADLQIVTDGLSNEALYDLLLAKKVSCPNCGNHDFLPVRSFNMMFETHQGVLLDTASKIYLRPETAQGIFINFKNILRTSRKKLPFGVAQVGKSFRNEITPGNFIFRTREFEQMELEFFCEPGKELEYFDYWRNEMVKFLTDLGIKEANIKLYNHPKEALSHYSNATTDIEFLFPWGFDELWGIASRTDFDLKSHSEKSKEDLSYLDPVTNLRYLPYVVEPSVGVERLVLAFFTNGYEEETLSDGQIREVLHIHPFLAPYKAAILPLVKNRHQELAQKIYASLAVDFDVTYDETQNIGKRYRRQDYIGTPYSITVDDNTLKDEVVTIRDRDTMNQVSVKISAISDFLKSKIKF